MKAIILTSSVSKVNLISFHTLLVLSESEWEGSNKTDPLPKNFLVNHFLPNLPKIDFLFTCYCSPSSISCSSLSVNSIGKSAWGLVMIFPCLFLSLRLYYSVVSLICLFVPHLKAKNTEQERSSTSPLLLCGDTLFSQFERARSSNRRCYY